MSDQLRGGTTIGGYLAWHAGNFNAAAVGSLNTITASEISFLSGVTSSIQNQLNDKSPTAGNILLVTVGTISAGTWNANTISVAKGGLNKTSAFQGDILFASSTTAYSALAKSTTANQYLKNSGTTNNPAWATIAYTDVSGTPTIGNATLTVEAATGISLSEAPTFTANATVAKTITITNSAPNVTTNLTTTHNATTVVVNSSDGTNGTIDAATTSLAGVMSNTDKTKLNGIATGAQVNVATNLGTAVIATNSREITSSTGTNITIPVVTTVVAGFMSHTDKTKLDGIATGAQVNVATNLTWSAGTTAGPTVNSSTGTGAAIPSASGTNSGIVTNGPQTFAGAKTLTGKLTTVASAAGASSIRLPHGAAPTTPVDGDVWTTTAGVYAQVQGATIALAQTGASPHSHNDTTTEGASRFGTVRVTPDDTTAGCQMVYNSVTETLDFVFA